MRTRWQVPLLLVAVLAACGAADEAPAAAASGLPIASAPTPREAASSEPPSKESGPAWVEPEDPVDAYRELVDKITSMRANPSLDIVGEIYAPKTPLIRAVRRDLKRTIEHGVRVVDGRTVLERVVLRSHDGDTALVDVRSRDEGWVVIDADGNTATPPNMCGAFTVQLRDGGDGWRIAALAVDRDDNVRRCER